MTKDEGQSHEGKEQPQMDTDEHRSEEKPDPQICRFTSDGPGKGRTNGKASVRVWKGVDSNGELRYAVELTNSSGFKNEFMLSEGGAEALRTLLAEQIARPLRVQPAVPLSV